VTLAAAFFVTAGCASADNEQEPKLILESTPSVAAEADSTPRIATGEEMQRLVDMATESLATKLGIEAADIVVVHAEHVTWRDSSIGCARPDTQYMQVLTKGSRIVLKANKAVYHYHSGGKRAPFQCARPALQKPAPYGLGES